MVHLSLLQTCEINLDVGEVVLPYFLDDLECNIVWLRLHIEVLPFLSRQQVIRDDRAERVRGYGNFASETRVLNRELADYHVHLVRHRLQDPRSEPRVQIGQAVGNRVVIHVLGTLEVTGYCHLLEPVAKPERFFNLRLPVDHVGHDLVLAVEVAASGNLLDARMQLLLPDLLAIQVRADAVHHQDEVDFFLLVAFDLLHAKLRL